MLDVHVGWCESIVVSFPCCQLVVESSISTSNCFCSETFFVTCSLLFFMVSEKNGGRGDQGEDAWSVKYKSIEFCCLQRTKPLRIQILSSEIAKLTIKPFYGSRNCCPYKLHVQSPYIYIYVTQRSTELAGAVWQMLECNVADLLSRT